MSQWRCASPMRRMQISLQPSPLMSFSIHTQPLARFLILPLLILPLPDLAAEAFAEYGVEAFRSRLAEPHRRFLLAE